MGSENNSKTGDMKEGIFQAKGKNNSSESLETERGCSKATWCFDAPCKNNKIDKKAGGNPPKNTENFFVRKEEFGTLYYSKSKVPVFHESYFVENSKIDKEFIFSAPITVNLEITDRCNLDCRHCYKPEDVEAGKMDLDTAERIISELGEMNVVGLQFMGGEPTLHDNLPEMLKKSKSTEMKNEMITNGYNISDSFIEYCSEFLDRLAVSIDGTEERHDEIRQTSGSFGAALDTLNQFSERGVYTEAIVTLNKLNYQDAEEVYEVASEQGADSVLLKRMLPQGKGSKIDDLYLDSEDLSKLEERMGGLLNKKTEVRFGAKCEDVSGEYTFFGCPGGRSSIVIRSSGDVYRCLYKRDEDTYIGNVHDRSLKNIWKSNNEDLRQRNNSCPDGCDYLDRCGGLCEL